MLVDMARWPPKTVADFSRIKGMPRPVKHRFGDQIIAAISRALSEPVPADLKRTNRPDRKRYDRDGDRPVVESLWKQVHDLAVKRGIDPGIVTSKKEITRRRARLLNGDTDLVERLTTGWRREMLGSLFDADSMKAVRHRGIAKDQDEDDSAGNSDESEGN